MNKILLHIEGLLVLILSVYLYFTFDFSWLLFLALLFVPDISMFGYVVSKKVGALTYNIFHTYSVPIIISIFGVIFDGQVLLAIGLIWTTHIGMDRMLGYGLKYTSNFKDTHLNRV